MHLGTHHCTRESRVPRWGHRGLSGEATLRGERGGVLQKARTVSWTHLEHLCCSGEVRVPRTAPRSPPGGDSNSSDPDFHFLMLGVLSALLTPKEAGVSHTRSPLRAPANHSVTPVLDHTPSAPWSPPMYLEASLGNPSQPPIPPALHKGRPFPPRPSLASPLTPKLRPCSSQSFTFAHHSCF